MENIILTNNKDLRLVGVKVGVLSTLRFELPLVSASATHVEVIITSGNVHSAYTATFIDDTKRWQCDIAASQFPAVGKQSYEIAYVLDGKQFWDGKGWIEIEDATTSGIEPQPRPEPYRYVVVSVNGYGADAQGAVRIPKTIIATNSPVTTEGYMEGDIYFNRETGAMWTLCDVQGTLTWVFNYKNYYTKAETDEAIDKLAAYYITSDVQGNPFATHAALVNATTYYSGGSVRVPTRNDYAIVVADETHNNEEWRYIYTENAQGVGQWEPQYPIETNDYTALSNKPQINGVTLAGNKTAEQLGLAKTADATLTERGPNKDGFSEWTLTGPDASMFGNDWTIERIEDGSSYRWKIESSTGLYSYADNTTSEDATELIFNSEEVLQQSIQVAATRTALSGYQLGSDDQHILASEAEAEALRTAVTGKQDALSAQQLANIAAVPSKANASDMDVALSQKQDRYTAWTVTKAVPEAPDATVEWVDGEWKFTYDGVVIGSTDNQNLAATSIEDLVGTYSATRAVIIDGKANRAANPTAGNLAALDENGNPTDSTIPAANVATKGNIPYDLIAKTINNGAVSLDDRTINAVAVSSSLASLTVNFPTATSGKARDFGLRLTVASGITTAPQIVLPQGVTCENADGEAPEIGADGAATILYFTETASGVFLVKGEVVQTIS